MIRYTTPASPCTRPAFIEVFLEDNKLFYRPVDAEKTEGVLLYENS